MRNGLMSLFCVLCFISSVFGDTDYYSPENILRFAEHLHQTRDYLRAAGEYQRYLFHSSKDSDGVLYRIGLCYRLAGDTEKAIISFRKITAGGSFRSAASYQIACSYFLSGQYENSLHVLDDALTDDADERDRFQLLSAFNYLHQRRWKNAEHLLSALDCRDDELSHIALSLRASAQEGMNCQRKNLILAGLMSAVVPGTGKFYCGEYGDGLYSLFLMGVSGLLAWDGFRDNGVHSVRGWLFGGITGVFYAGNVYGSAIAAQIYNHHLESSFLKRLPAVPTLTVVDGF